MLANRSVRQRSSSPIGLWLLLMTLFIVPLWLSYSMPSQVAVADQSNASAVLVDVPQESPSSVQPQSEAQSEDLNASDRTSDRSKEGNARPDEALPAAVPVRYDASDASDATHQGSDVYCVFLPLLTGGSGTTTTQANSVANRSAGSAINCLSAPPATILRSSPSNGEDGVAVTRETIIEFSEPIDPDSVTDAAISAQFGGNTLATRLHISADKSTVTLFYNEALPASARVRVTIDGEQLLDANGNPVDVDGNGSAGGTTTIDFDTLSLTVIEGTSVCGRVFASELDTSDRGTSVNVPLQGVTITVDGMEDTLRTTTDSKGNFCLDPAPAGRFFVHIDGRTATNGVPEGTYYPFVGKAWESTIGQQTNVGTAHLPLVPKGTLQPVSQTEETTINLAPSVLEQFPEFADVSITVPANALYSDDGTRGGSVGIAPVPPDRLPGQLPEELNFPVVITVQTDGATNFDQPAPVCFPNLPDPDTGETLAAGEKSALFSFNHDTGRWEIAGSMTVSEDGTLICADEGVGVRAPGWHGTQPGAGGDGGPIGGGGGGGGSGGGGGGDDGDKCENEGDPCDDGDACTMNDRCQAGVCKGDLPGPACSTNATTSIDYSMWTTTMSSARGNLAKPTNETYSGSTCFDEASKAWQFRVNSMKSLGRINLTTVGSTEPNPVVGGNVSGNPTDFNYYCNIINHMSGYKGNPGGGRRTPGWHTLAASRAHEEYHRDVDFPNMLQPRWTSAENKIESFTAACTMSQTQAEQLMQKNTKIIFSNMQSQYYNAVNIFAKSHNKKPLNDGAYCAGQAVLNQKIADIQAFATTQGFAACPPRTSSPPTLQGEPSVLLVDLVATVPQDLLDVTDSVQISVQGVYSDDSTLDLTLGSTGTTYLASDPNIVSVDDNGLITAIAPGATVVMATHFPEGIDLLPLIASVEITVLSPDDTDNDLLPNSYENAAGLNPNNPADAGEDLDTDGLTNLDEYIRGTEPFNSDTDGDGVDDGTEVSQGTDPLSARSSTPTPQLGLHYFAILNLDRGTVDLRGTAGSNGVAFDNLVLAPNTEYQVYIIQAETLNVGRLIFSTPNSGENFTLPAIVLRTTNFVDSDSDGLNDDGEFIMGTDSDNPDTDGDGIPDGAEVQQGTNPLDGLAVATGIIGTVNTPGTALDVCALNDIAAVADSSAGVSVFNVFNGMNPSIIAQVDTQGNAQAVACAGDLIAVADGEAGLAIIDISDPPAARVIHQIELDGRAQTVAAGGSLAYVGTSDGKVAVVELSSGAGLYGLTFSEAVHDVALSGDELYVLTASSLFIYGTSSGGVEELGSLPVSGSPAPLEVGRKLFVGGNLAYVGYFTGYSVIDVSDPTTPQLIGSPPETQAAMHDIVANGSGLVLGTTSFAGPNTLAVSLYDSSDPTDVTQFITSFDTPGAARALAIYNGLAYVADQAGMQVINYLAYDSQGVPPTIALASNVAGNEVAEGRLVRVTADVSDDVQVRNVEFYLDGNRIAIDGTFPFEYRFPAPSLSTQSTFTVMARAKDTGGNTTESNVLTVNVIPDTEPPTVAIVAPVAGEFFTRLDSGIPVKVNATDNVRVADLSFKVDSTPVSANRISLNTYEVAMPAAIGTYQISVVATDGAGLSAESTPISVEVIDFEVGDQLSAKIDYSGDLDRYAFSAEAGQVLFFDWQSGANRNWQWQLADSAGTVIFNQDLRSDPGAHTLELGGTYTMIIGNRQRDHTGSYRLQLLQVPPPDEFSIAIGDVVSNGVPESGAGNIEQPGAVDLYAFSATADQRVFFDWQADFNFGDGWRWQLMDSAGTVIFDKRSLSDDPGAYLLELGGSYTMMISAPQNDDPGTYQFQLLHVPQADEFTIAIGDVVSNGLPASGAGNIEQPAAVDLYTFSATAGQLLYFDLQAGANSNWRWQLTDSSGALIFNRRFSDDPGAYTLSLGGTYTMRIGNEQSDNTGTYQFQLLNVPPPQEFTIAIGDIVSDGVPAPGAGNIEKPGALDAYTFEASAGQLVYFDLQAGFNQNWRWQLADSTGRVIFNQSLFADPGAYTLELGGTYTMIIGNLNSDDSGPYQFQLLPAPEPDIFGIALGDVVSNGVPAAGAGNLEAPAAQDIYTFNAPSGELLFFDLQTGTNQNWQWALQDSEGTSIFNRSFSSDPGAYTLEISGTYTVTVSNLNSDETGSYRFKLWDVPPPEEFTIAIGDVVSNGVPEAGAGNIEQPAALDRYTFLATAGQVVYFDWQSEFNSNWRWQLVDSAGTVIFERSVSSDPGAYTLELGGTYTMIIGNQNSDETGTYQFQLLDVPAPDAFTIAIGHVVSDGVPQAGAGNIEEPGSLDRYTFEASAGQVLFFDWQSEFNSNWRWQLLDSAGTAIFNRSLSSDPGAHTLELGATYTMIIGNQNSEETGTYQLQLLEVPPAQTFTIAIGDVVSDGVPQAGAGNIEEPGALDIYTFDATAGQEVFFDWQAESNSTWRWKLENSDGTVIFEQNLSNDPGTHILELGGTYTMIIGNQNSDETGTYQFELRDPGQSNAFQINIGDVVSDGVPAPGAGNIEEPGSLDSYTFEATAGQVVYFDLQEGFNDDWRWIVEDSQGTVIFNQLFRNDPGSYELELGGTYTMTIGNQNSDHTGTYKFQLLAFRRSALAP